jgi:hypothetical protein
MVMLRAASGLKAVGRLKAARGEFLLNRSREQEVEKLVCLGSVGRIFQNDSALQKWRVGIAWHGNVVPVGA